MPLESLSPIHPKNPAQKIADKQPRPPLEQIEEEMPAERNAYAEGMANIHLPSRGVFYLNKFKNLESLKVRPIDWRDEDILTTPSFHDDGTVYLEILKNTIIDENGFQAKQLVSVDRDTILLWLRSTAFGNTFEVDFQCPICRVKKENDSSLRSDLGLSTLRWELDKLKFPEYPEEIYNELVENGEYTVTTLLTKLKVKLTVPNLGKTLDLEKRLALREKNNGSEKKTFATSALLSVVNGIEVNGRIEREKSKISDYFNKIRLPLGDSRYLLQKATELNLNYNTAQKFICKDCNHVEEGVELPIMHKNFFWPES